MSHHSENYSNSEYYEMILCVGAAEGSINRGRELYRERFIDGRPLAEQRRLPSYTCFRNMCLRLHSTGTFHPSASEGRPSSHAGSALETRIIEHFERNPRTSTRRAAAVFNVSHSLVWRTLRDDGQHPYHFRRTQELIAADYVPRINFCAWYRTRVQADPNFAASVLWTDEASFTRNGILNQHNEHVWARTNPHAFSTHNFQHQWRINVWAGIVGDTLIGPIWLPARLNTETYMNVLSEHVEEQLEELSVTEYSNLIFQHDGAPAHFARPVREYLNGRYAEWIGRGGPIPWPARSPDLTPLDFFLWGFVKNYVYAKECSSEEEMKARIQTAFTSITPAMLTNARLSLHRRTSLCIQEEGRHFEPFL